MWDRSATVTGALRPSYCVPRRRNRRLLPSADSARRRHPALTVGIQSLHGVAAEDELAGVLLWALLRIRLTARMLLLEALTFAWPFGCCC